MDFVITKCKSCQLRLHFERRDQRHQAKSTLVSDLIYYLKGIPMIVCMSGTEEGNGFYKKYMHDLCIHGDYKPEIVSSLIKQQRTKLKKCNKAGIDPNTRPDLGVGLLLDDLGHDKKVLKQKDVRMIFMNGRHWKICLIVSLQYMMDMSPDLRTNIDYVFALRENNRDNQQRLYKYFFGCFQKFSHFQEAFNECTNNYECLVLDNTSRSTKIEDCVYYYKATPDLEYKIGSKELWEYLDSRYKKDYDDDEEDGPGPVSNSGISIKKSPMMKIVDNRR
jgi:hypothetical protein